MDTRVIVEALVRFEGKFLVGRRAATKKFGAGKWELISGNVDSGESAEDIILRELKEEVGLTGVISKAGAVFELSDTEARWVVLPFLIDVMSGSAVLNKKDHSEIRWVTAEELGDFSDLTELPQLRQAGLL